MVKIAKMLFALVMGVSSVPGVSASIGNPAILPTPPMGFNNWARFMCNLNETLFTTTADAMKANGLLAAGYNRLNLDDCWMQYSRAANGSLQTNTTLFPHGLPWLADYVKSRGFKFGVYQDSGNLTCGGYPGSKGYEETDARDFEKMGFDYLKLDGCNVAEEQGRNLEQEYKYLYGKWHDVLTNSSSPMIFSQSAPAYFSGGPDFSNQTNNSDWYRVMDWVPKYGELARHSQDVAVYGLYNVSQYWESIMTNYGYEVLLARYQEPGFYNDPDFIISDWPWLTLDEKKSHFALWASFSAPLIISAYIPDLTSKELAYLTNKDIIAIDQDPLALQATLVSQDGTWDVLTKNLANGDRLLTVLNRGNHSAVTNVDLRRVGLRQGDTYQAKDLWTGNTKSIKNSINIKLPSHATAIYRVAEPSWIIPTGMIFNTASKRCLTAGPASGKTSLTFTNCKATDNQVWSISPEGQISPLSAPKTCIMADSGGVLLSSCDVDEETQEWIYYRTGNLKSTSTEQCFMDLAPMAGMGTCGDEMDMQVFGLPSGVAIVR
ncbi:putative alpha-galactosidase [Tothia fuscella]|uniref:Alpha-galactosidase n=1 Tax=Tothia fuscella TaxID=1048955 RepID=A0A9P4TVU0_9PEZI|nr:putative alpha-galactosidase [Tothia fuscella]